MYTIKELALMSGLTERTLRSYLQMGILKGQKVNGVWKFNEEQVEEFFNTDYAKCAMQTNRKALLFDYLRNAPEDKNSACVVMNFPKENNERVSAFFCNAVNKGKNLQMTFDTEKGMNKVILIGDYQAICEILNEFKA